MVRSHLRKLYYETFFTNSYIDFLIVIKRAETTQK